jgi:hypothetical protein
MSTEKGWGCGARQAGKGKADVREIGVQLKVQLDVLIIYSLFLSIFSLNVSGAIAPILRSSNCSLHP